MNCPYCNHTNSYNLSTGQQKCTNCQRKFSPQKYQRDIDIVTCFLNDKNANQCAKELQITYVTVSKKYQDIRQKIVTILENDYNRSSVGEYDEYVYLPKSKKKSKENIFDAHDFLTFCYEETKVYNLLMPTLHRYKKEFLEDGLEETYFKEFSKFMMFNKIAKTNQRENTITQFWEFFEDQIVKHKGVNEKNFIYYLKECEFKFNYSKEEAKQILLHLYTKQ